MFIQLYIGIDVYNVLATYNKFCKQFLSSEMADKNGRSINCFDIQIVVLFKLGWKAL